MRRGFAWRPEWIFNLCVGMLFGATFLRSILLYYSNQDVLLRSLGLLIIWLALLLSEPAISRRWRVYFPFYLLIQSALTFVLLFNPDPPDFYAVLFAILSAQVMMHYPPRQGILCIALFTPLTFIPALRNMPVGMAIGATLVYAASNALLAAYVSVNARIRTMRMQNQDALYDLEEANRKLREYSTLVGQMGVTRERNRLARDLHDSVTQSIFSMTLATQSALLLLERDPSRVSEQLTRISDLATSAMNEMQTLIAELNPQKSVHGGLASALSHHLQERQFPEGLQVSLDVEGNSPLAAGEEQGLFRIAQESLNNIVKHAEASQAGIRLHLSEPFWMEIQDNGKGFNLQQGLSSGRVGLSSIRERAGEIGWGLQIYTAPNAGTRIHLEKARPGSPSLENSTVAPSEPIDIPKEGPS